MLQVENLGKNFGSKKAVDGITFQIRPGVITGLLGPNGAGKTTTMRLITGFLDPTEGSISFNGQPVSENPAAFRLKLGYLPETAAVYPDMLVSEYLEFMARARGIKNPAANIDRMLELCELRPWFDTPVGILSKGLKQRVMLAGTLIHDPEIIILDEPTSGLDPNQISQIRDLIKNLGKERTLVLSTHILQEVEDVCDEVIIINQGKIVANSTVEGLRHKNQVFVSARANLAEMKEALAGLGETDEVAGDNPEDFKSYILSMQEDKPQAVFNALCKKGIEAREIRIYRKSLESIFEELTK